MSGTSLVLFTPYGSPSVRGTSALPAVSARPAEVYELRPIPRDRPDPSRMAAAQVYAATQARRCAPVARPTRGRIVDLVG